MKCRGIAVRRSSSKALINVDAGDSGRGTGTSRVGSAELKTVLYRPEGSHSPTLLILKRCLYLVLYCICIYNCIKYKYNTSSFLVPQTTRTLKQTSEQPPVRFQLGIE